MFCKNCGSKINGYKMFCGNCGTKISDVQLSSDKPQSVSSPVDSHSAVISEASSSAAEEWYCVLNNQARGPFSENAMREMIKNGTLSLDVLVWNSALDSVKHDWFPLGKTKLARPIPETGSSPSPFLSFPKEKDSQETVERLLSEGKMSSRARRFWANTLDSIGCFLYQLIISSPEMTSNLKPEDYAILKFVLYFNAIYIFICILFLHINGQTVGKKILGIRVVNLDGNIPSLPELVLLRNSVLWMSGLFFAFIQQILPFSLDVLGFAIVFMYIASKCRMLKKDHRTLDDIIAKTVVVKV
jgi:uncharacterized RDD family membrane protein YckC